MKTTTTKCSAQIADAISKFVSGQIKAEGGKAIVVDLMQAEGVNPSALQAPEKGADRSVFESYKAAVVRGFPAAMQKLVQADSAIAKSFSVQQKADRRRWTMRIGADMRDLRVALERRYKADEAAAMTDEEREAAAVEAAASATLEAKMGKVAAEWIAKLEKTEAAKFPVAEAIKLWKALAVLANK